jgi:hypothetical protein
MLKCQDIDDIRKVDKLPCFGHTLQLVVKDNIDKLGREPCAVVSKCYKLSNTLHQISLVKRSIRKKSWRKPLNSAKNATYWSSLYIRSAKHRCEAR